jgi:hypothetical protein
MSFAAFAFKEELAKVKAGIASAMSWHMYFSNAASYEQYWAPKTITHCAKKKTLIHQIISSITYN